MKRILSIALIVAVATILASCGTLKRHKQAEQLSASTETKNELETKAEIKTKAETKDVAKGTVKTTETVDTNITVPGSTVTGGKPLEEITSGKPLVVDVNGHSLSVRYNPGTGNIEANSTTKDKSVPVKATRVTEADWESIGTTNTSEHAKASQSASNEAKSDTSSSKVNASTEVGPTPWYFSPWPWIIAFAIGAFLYLRYGSPLKWIAALFSRKS